jgi:acyl-CoA thioesterase-1
VIGAGYARDYDRVFQEVARATGADLYPDLLAGVAGVAALNQGDGIHPNPRGVQVIVTRLARAVARSLARRA